MTHLRFHTTNYQKKNPMQPAWRKLVHGPLQPMEKPKWWQWRRR